jgi:mannose-6-phosphate isomerase-like protein (cupin superfamily)
MSVGIAEITPGVEPSQTTLTDFARDGVIGPIRLFSQAQCRAFAARLRQKGRPDPVCWRKGGAITDRFLYELATRPALISLLTPLLGDDIILWGAQKIKRSPGATHPWHTDIESSVADKRFVSVWIGIENASQESALQFITRSHLVGKSLQQVSHEKATRRGAATAEDVLAWARELDEDAEFLQPQMSDGEALIFDGRLWHASHNSRRSGARLALLLQYAEAGAQVREPDLEQLEWPFRFRETPPPVLVVSGASHNDFNLLAPPPEADTKGKSFLFSATHRLPLPLAEDAEKGWRPHRIFRGKTPILEFLNCHMSVLSPGHSPHSPHAHAEEELLIILDGEADLIISHTAEVEGARIERARPGTFVYYPAEQHHTIRNSSQAPVTYLMFKWRGVASRTREPLATTIFNYNLIPDTAKPRWGHRLLKQATAYLGWLKSHVTVLEPGVGYEPHIDLYDVAILLLDGTVETIGRTLTAPGVIFYQAGEPHGMRNIGDAPARYLVFEFHAPTVTEAWTPKWLNARRATNFAKRVLHWGRSLPFPRPYRTLKPKTNSARADL